MYVVLGLEISKTARLLPFWIRGETYLALVLGARLLILPTAIPIVMSKTTSGIITAISLLSIITPTMVLQIQSGDASTGNTTQAANQTGEQMQTGMENVTQESKSAANQTGEQMQTGMANVTQESKSAGNKTGEEGQSMMNQAGEALQQINPFK